MGYPGTMYGVFFTFAQRPHNKLLDEHFFSYLFATAQSHP